MQRGQAGGGFHVQGNGVLVLGHAPPGALFPMADKIADFHGHLVDPLVAGVDSGPHETGP
ncbi:hypothetical protein D9M70_598950 [compost metagenome]